MDGGAGTWVVGADVVAVQRLARLESVDAFRDRAFHSSELRGASAGARGQQGAQEHLAGVLAVKEAVAKAFGVLPPPWSEIEVRSTADGPPTVYLAPRLATRGEVLHVSVGHDGGVAVAAVLVRLYGGTSDPP